MDLGMIIVIASIVSVVGPLLFWAFVVWAGVKAAQKFQAGGSGGPFNSPFGGGPAIGVDPQFIALMQQMQQIIQQAQANGGNPSAYMGGNPINLGGLPPHVQAQFQSKMMQAQRDMRAMDNLRRQQADLHMSDMLSQASSAGIDVSSWKYR